MIVSAGFGEETLFRGYAFERLGKLFGHGSRAKTAIVVFTSCGSGWITIRSRAGRRRTGDGRWSRLRVDLCSYGAAVRVDVSRTRRSSDRAWPHLLESRIQGGAPAIQLGYDSATSAGRHRSFVVRFVFSYPLSGTVYRVRCPAAEHETTKHEERVGRLYDDQRMTNDA